MKLLVVNNCQFLFVQIESSAFVSPIFTKFDLARLTEMDEMRRIQQLIYIQFRIDTYTHDIYTHIKEENCVCFPNL